MWNNFVEANPDFKKEDLPDSWYFHDNEKDANRLGELMVTGKKKASSSLYAWYGEANAELPKIGTKHIITDLDGKALAIIETKKVDTIPFNQISEAYARLYMSRIVEPLVKWKKAHWHFFANVMTQNEILPTEDMLIVCERFETFWTGKR